MIVKNAKDTIEWYNKNAVAYSQAANAHSSAHGQEQIDQFVNLLPKNTLVLDVGCGSGRDTNILIKNGLRAIGIDLSSGLIEVARKTFPTLEFIEGDMTSLPFEDTRFEGIWAHASLLHLETVEDVKKALSEFCRVLKQNGVLHVMVKAQTGKEKTAIVTDSLSKHDRFFQYFTKPEMESLLSGSGFETILLEQYKETDRNPQGRPEVEWILALAKKK